MLKLLSIKNLAIIEQIRVEFREGLNLLTGETGAGKSMIVDALAQLLGGRAATDLLRTGARAGLVEGVFELAPASRAAVDSLLAEAGAEPGAGEELILRRELPASGRGRLFINDQLVTATTSRAVGRRLVEIYGQGEPQQLTAGSFQLELLDSFAGCLALRRETAAAYTRWKTAREAVERFARDVEARRGAGERLREQLLEIERVAPAGPLEERQLAEEKSALQHAERVLQLAAGAYAELYEDDTSVLAHLASVERSLQELSGIDGRVAAAHEALQAAVATLTDIAEGLRGYGAGVDFSPARLAEIEDRLAELARLQRKTGRDLRGVLALREELAERMAQFDTLAEREQELRGELDEAAGAYLRVARRLSQCRREAGAGLEARVPGELKELAMERARFIVSLETAEPGGGTEDLASSFGEEGRAVPLWSPRGADRVQFLLAANVGEEARPLSRVASGGELSRLMLALRTVCRKPAAEAPADDATLVFDEIDAGIGGGVAEAVGRRLQALAATQQVLCVTHQPQIACFADHHYAVSKRVAGGRTVMQVRELDERERIGELARMIGGAEVAVARETARWLLASAREAARAMAGGPPPVKQKRGRKPSGASNS